MRSTIIPAQITTVEDKIAGNLNVAQILLLLFPIFAASFIYAIFPPDMKLVYYKIILVIFVSIVSLVLAIRSQDKIVVQWLIILIKFYRRPEFYISDKNDLSERLVELPLTKESAPLTKIIPVGKTNKREEVTISDLIKLNQALSSRRLAVSFELGKKR